MRPGAEVLGRLGAAGDAEAQALRRRPAGVAGGDVAGQERVAGADRGDGLARLDRARGTARRAVRRATVGEAAVVGAS